MALVLVCVTALGATVLVARGSGDQISQASGFQGSIMPEGVRAPDFDLHDQDGKPVSMRSLRGKPVAVTFLYTHCRDTCPADAQTLRGALDLLGHDVPALAVAVDPPRDTEQSARAFLSKQSALGRIDFVLGSKAQLSKVWKGFAIQPQSVTTEHQSRFTLVDKKGFQRIGYPGSQATPEALAHDLQKLESEPG
jgi:protein SCO1/2